MSVARFNTNLKIIELYSFNKQAFTFWLHHYSKFCLILICFLPLPFNFYAEASFTEMCECGLFWRPRPSVSAKIPSTSAAVQRQESMEVRRRTVSSLTSSYVSRLCSVMD